jgi:hypothetical protein
MEPEISLLCSQGFSTGFYLKSDVSSPYHPNSISPRSILILSTHLRLGLPSGHFPPGFPTNNLHAFFFLPIRTMCPVHFMLTSFYLNLKKVTNYDTPHYEYFSDFLSLHSSLVQIFSLAPHSETTSVYVSTIMSETKFRTHAVPQAKSWSRIFWIVQFE